MSSTITFYIARHGKTLMNTLVRVQGWCDSPLTPEGIEMARYLGAGLQDIRFESVYTSDLRRSGQTAGIVLAEQGQTDLPIIEKEGFREACFGSFEAGSDTKMWDDAAQFLHYANRAAMNADLLARKISNEDIMRAITELDTMGLAETFGQVEARTQQTLREIAEEKSAAGEDKNVLIIAHGLCIVVMLYNLGGKNMPSLYIDNATVCKLTYKDGLFNVETVGDAGYLNRGRERLKANL
ncbi:histidine phosphatase family protein [Viscerimonas tarda]